jgi:hypothetical protein
VNAVRLVIGVATASALLVGAPVQAAPEERKVPIPRALDRDEPIRMELTLCKDDTDLDCIESLGLVTRQGFVAGEIVSRRPPISMGPIQGGGRESGPTTGQVLYRSETWRIPGMKTESGLDTLDPFIALTTPGLRWYAADQSIEYDVAAQLEFEVSTSRSVLLDTAIPCDTPDGRCGRPEHMDPDQTFRAIVRTSWFAPAWARSHLGNTVLRVEAIKGGGSRITVQGKALNSPGFLFGGGRDQDLHRRDSFDYNDYRWTVYMMDANDPNFPERCSDFGFPLVSGNQWGSGTPMWNPRTQEMSLEMSAPHYDGDGKVFRGTYEAFIPSRYAQCLWKTDPKRLASQLTVEVTAEDGQESAATKSIAFRDGGVRIVARNFTFSSPKITVRPKGNRR